MCVCKLCVSKLCVGKLSVGKWCVSGVCERCVCVLQEVLCASSAVRSSTGTCFVQAL